MKTIYVAVSENDRRLVIDGSFDLLAAFLHVIQHDRKYQDRAMAMSDCESPGDYIPAEVQHEAS